METFFDGGIGDRECLVVSDERSAWDDEKGIDLDYTVEEEELEEGERFLPFSTTLEYIYPF